MEHCRKLERMYQAAPTNRDLQPDLTIPEGAAELHIAAREDFYHTADATHGVRLFQGHDHRRRHLLRGELIDGRCPCTDSKDEDRFLRPDLSPWVTLGLRHISRMTPTFAARQHTVTVPVTVR